MFDVPANLRSKVCSADDAAAMIASGAVVAASGYTSAGDPKATLLALARRGELQEIDLVTAAQLSVQVENALADASVLRRRAPFSVSPAIRKLANQQSIRYVEIPMSRMARTVASGAFGIPDVMIVEALGITPQNELILTTSVGITPLLCDMARNIIVEINTTQPAELVGVHDIFSSVHHTGAMVRSVTERIGSTTVSIDVSKIIAIVFSNQPDEEVPKGNAGDADMAICRNLHQFLDDTYSGTTLPPIQTGIGGLSQAIIQSFSSSKFQDIEFFCGALQPDMVELLAQGKARSLSGGSIALSSSVRKRFQDFGPELKDHLVIRSMEVSNGAAAVAGLGVIALNTGIEIDIFGNVNSSHINGSAVVNGVGGGATFAENAALSVVMMPSIRKNGNISCFVPQTPHVDIIHHHVDIVISEHGIADLRGKDDVECARLIIDTCAHPDYRDALHRELNAGMKRGGHHPVCLSEAFSWHERLHYNMTMRPEKLSE